MNEYFNIQEKDGLRLIVPAHSAAIGNAGWTPKNVWWRSRVETLDGQVVSQGFGKFFNVGQGPDDLRIAINDIAQAIEHNDALATLKIDGSLLIRSVYNNKVYLRTRGSFGYSHLENAFEIDTEFTKKYPKLFDVGFAKNHSLLFEWVSPFNTIVIKYPEPALYLIGAVDHRTMSYVRMSELTEIGQILNIPVTQFFPLTSQGWADLYTDLEKNKDIEGYVIRLRHEQSLVKVKCAHYLTKHALKSNLTTEKLADMYFQYGRPTFSQFVDKFKESFDEEITMWAMPAISTLYDGVRELEAIEQHIQTKVTNWKTARERKETEARPRNIDNIRREDRKEFAIRAQQEYGHTKKFAYAMSVYLGEMANREKLLKSLLLQNTKQVDLSIFGNNKTGELE